MGAARTIAAPLLPPAKPGGRPRSVNLRVILNGLLYVLRSGCQWHLLPQTYGPWSTVYAYYRRWRMQEVWEQIHAVLRERLRRQSGRAPTPSADAQRCHPGQPVGQDHQARRAAGL